MSEYNSSDEEIDPPSDEAFASANSLIKEAYDILKGQAKRVQKEKEAFDSVAKKLEHVHFAKTIKLNVGGQYFTTSLETLTKDPGSMLHAMFSGRFDTKPAEDGSYFIDRDGTHFRYILNYLRLGRLLLPDDTMIRNEVFAEAEFYQIQGITDELKPKLFRDSTILSVEQKKVLTSWIKEELKQTATSTFVLLFRASRNGWASTNFHSCCDNKGPTITVVKSGNYIFGGYADVSWNSKSLLKARYYILVFTATSRQGKTIRCKPQSPIYGPKAVINAT